MNIDYQIAKDYLLKLPIEERESLCKSTLQGLQETKKSKRQVENEYRYFLKKSKSFQDFKKKYGMKK